MMEIRGEFGTAVIHTDDVESTALSQIYNLLNQKISEGAHTRIMPDVHAGAGCVIGYTAHLRDKIVPNLIGVDIGCGVTTYRLGHKNKLRVDFEALDDYIKRYVPSGKNVNEDFNTTINIAMVTLLYAQFEKENTFFNYMVDVEEICKRIGIDETYIWNSLCSLGGGNHFIEVDEDENGELWLTIHSGSRNFGLKIAQYHQKIAETHNENYMPDEEYNERLHAIRENHSGKYIGVAVGELNRERAERNQTKNPTGLEYLTGQLAADYLHDMEVAQLYARLNRRMMLERIIGGHFGFRFDTARIIESTHNYIDFEDNIIRKGAISAYAGQDVVIPLTMADGIIVGKGRSNPEWNYSAPHGAGRAMSRSHAKSTLNVAEFQKTMRDRNIYTTTANSSTLDEAPEAYKNAQSIIDLLSETVDIEHHMFPVYNFKA